MALSLPWEQPTCRGRCEKHPRIRIPPGPPLTLREDSQQLKTPSTDNLDLAYETGVHLGDSCLQYYFPHYYRYIISGSRQNEQRFYRGVLRPLLRDLYDIDSGISESRGSIYLYAYSKGLVLYKHDVMEMPIGPKCQMAKLPGYVFKSTREWAGPISLRPL